MNSTNIICFFMIIISLILSFHGAHSVYPDYDNRTSNSCTRNLCGMGTCRNITRYPFYECYCPSGWLQYFDNKTAVRGNAACVFPQCSFNYSCYNNNQQQQQFRQQDLSDDDPQNSNVCSIKGICGQGYCRYDEFNSNEFPYTCVCDNGATNLLGNSTLPCFPPCAFGDECSILHTNNDTPPALPPSDGKEKEKQGEGIFLNLYCNVYILVLI
ncbi:hypothetical protein RND81_10G148400 [Saponaria officinalis]|uniref:Uncharacterized protein n=1 Tax=Saponaria officinalis TaxID=3572 RepID=A0AAW1I4L5_SAPOF